MWTVTDWTMARNMCENFRRTLPSLIDEVCVHSYRQIVESLEGAADLNLTDFKIDEKEVSCRMVRSRSANISSGPIMVRYTTKKYCDSDYFYGKLDHLRNFLSTVVKTMSIEKSRVI
jgi:hypothetical protein